MCVCVLSTLFHIKNHFVYNSLPLFHSFIGFIFSLLLLLDLSLAFLLLDRLPVCARTKCGHLVFIFNFVRYLCAVWLMLSLLLLSAGAASVVSQMLTLPFHSELNPDLSETLLLSLVRSIILLTPIFNVFNSNKFRFYQ